MTATTVTHRCHLDRQHVPPVWTSRAVCVCGWASDVLFSGGRAVEAGMNHMNEVAK